MREYLKKNAVKYTIAFCFAGLLANVYISMRDFAGAAKVDQYRMLCDAISLPGMLLVLFGGLMWVSGKGAVDGLAFAGKKLLNSLIPGNRIREEERYADYVERKRESRKGGYGFLFISGGICVAVSVIFYVLYYTAK